MVDTHIGTCRHIYKEMFDLKGTLDDLIDNTHRDSTLSELLPKDLKKSIGRLILQRWANLHTAMHGAGFCLHPEYHGDKYEQEKNLEAMKDLLTMCEKVHCKPEGSNKALKAMW